MIVAYTDKKSGREGKHAMPDPVLHYRYIRLTPKHIHTKIHIKLYTTLTDSDTFTHIVTHAIIHSLFDTDSHPTTLLTNAHRRLAKKPPLRK